MPVPPSYAPQNQRAAFAQWLSARLEASRVSKSKVAAALGHDTIQQLNKFLRAEILPMPLTLRRICRVIGVPWTEAYANAGYYGEILGALARLARLARIWAQEDHADPLPPSTHGILRIGDTLAIEALAEQRYRKRYTIGSWEEAPMDPPPESDYEGASPEIAAIFKATYEHRSKHPTTVSVVVPKPLAVAILIAIAGFPRRGDIYKSGAKSYAANLFAGTVDLVNLAECTVPHEFHLPALLQSADNALKDSELPFGLRRIIAAEYTVQWADHQCNMYAHIARLATHDYFGVAGSSVDNLTPEYQLPQIRRAVLPDLTEFSNLEDRVFIYNY